MYKLILIAGIVLLTSACSSQNRISHFETSAKLLHSPADFFSQPEKYLEWQTAHILDITEKALLRFPPQDPEPMERQMAMLMLDAVFHDVEAPNRPAVQAFHKMRTVHALKEMQQTKVKKGAMIWKLYDMGMVVRTKSLTAGFDLIRGVSAKSAGFMLSDSVMAQIVKQCDILFISHNHKDHTDEWVIQKFIEQGKPVVATTEIMQGNLLYGKIIHPDREPDKKQYIPVNSGKTNLEIVVFPGHQGNLLNNVTIVKMPEGITVCHTGDQSVDEDFSWVDKLAGHYKIDILIPNCWTPDPLRVAKGYQPKLIIPAHENELGHTIDHREAYALDYSRWNVPDKKIIMTWGESFHYKN